MTELPIATSASSPAAGGRAVSGATPARGDTEDMGASPFQDALAQELRLGPGVKSMLLPGLHIPGALTKDDSATDAGADAKQAAAADLPLDALLPGLPWSPPTEIVTDTGKSAAVGADAPALALDAAPTRAKGITRLNLAAPGEAAADFAASGKFSAANGIEIPSGTKVGDAASALRPGAAAGVHALHGTGKPADASEISADVKGQNSEQPAHLRASAPDVAAAAGKPTAHAEAEIGREAAFAARLLEQQHKAGPTPTSSTTQAHAAAPATQIHAAATAQTVQAPVAVIDAPVGERGWDQGLGDKLTWMATNKHQVAELHLNPPDLGPLKVTLTLNHEHASAQFVSAHSQVRDAIETAMPRLREMLAGNGITLGDASVAADSFREPAQQQHEPRAYSSAPSATPADPGTISRGELLLRRARGMVDTFV